MTKLILPLKAEYFNAIRDGSKLEEYRLANDYWRKRLIIGGVKGVLARSFESIVLTWGYPKSDDMTRRIELPWRGWSLKVITHPLFGPDPVKVFAIDVSGRAALGDRPPMTETARYHAIERTSPKGPGHKFVGTCWQCGKTGLTLADTRKECENVAGLTEEQSLLIAIEEPTP